MPISINKFISTKENLANEIVLPTGEKIAVEQLEGFYGKSELVKDICIIGMQPFATRQEKATERLLAVIVPNFSYLRQNHIAISREAIRFELDSMGTELPESIRVRDYQIRVRELPRNPENEIQRDTLREEIALDAQTQRKRNQQFYTFTINDQNILSSNIGTFVADAIKTHRNIEIELHPNMNLELDLEFDSLARAELFASIEAASNMTFSESEIAQALTIQDTINLIKEHRLDEASTRKPLKTDWSKILNDNFQEPKEIRNAMKRSPITMFLAFLILKFFYIIFRIFFRFEVTGKENLTNQEIPYLICPNHQSYLDPLVVCCVYPFKIFNDSFHFGAREVFRGFPMAQIARILDVVLISADKNTVNTMKAGAYGLRHNRILNVYPEGERTIDGNLHPFKKGVAILASELNMSIVPVTIDGLQKIWGRGSSRLRFAKMRLSFGVPFDANSVTNATDTDQRYQEITDELERRIADNLARFRK